MWDEQVDALIDAAARRMTAAEPSSDFTARVRERLETPEARRWPRAWILSPLAAAALIAIGVLVARPDLWRKAAAPHHANGSIGSTATTSAARSEDSRPPAMAPPDPTAPAMATLASRPGPDQNEVTRTLQTSRSRRDANAGSTAADGDSAFASSDIAALAPPPLDVAPVGVHPLGAATVASADSIRLEQLDAIAPVAVTPLAADAPQRRFQ